MIDMKKLTRAQQEVVELLKKPGAIIDVSLGWNILIRTSFGVYKWCTRPTLNALLRLNIIKPTDNKDIYVLSEKE